MGESGQVLRMAVNRRHLPFPPAAVWSVWADGTSYADWVVGTSAIRDVDPQFPAVGSRIHYTVGRGPVRHEGHTEVLDTEPGRRLDLQAHAWPMGAARISLTVDAAAAGGSNVTIEEYPSQGLGKIVHNPVTDRVLKLRNVETLRRLARLAARRTSG